MLGATLIAETGTAMAAGHKVANLMTYNGHFLGPTTHVRPGDRVKLTPINRSSLPTNMHDHGFHESLKGRQDRVFLTIKPGWHVGYEVEISDDHDACPAARAS